MNDVYSENVITLSNSHDYFMQPTGVCLFVFLFVVSSPSSLPTRHTNHLPSKFCYSTFQLTSTQICCERLRAYRTTCTTCEKELLPRERWSSCGRVLEFDVQCLHWANSGSRDTHASVARIWRHSAQKRSRCAERGCLCIRLRHDKACRAVIFKCRSGREDWTENLLLAALRVNKT